MNITTLSTVYQEVLLLLFLDIIGYFTTLIFIVK